ncbi:alpha/beta fold hydrolase [Deinococcus enclensis]|uniref:Pimeloyl-ACP methyl ester carboxylesterase n=1 Tax=Deinococcus enclensis TaxID=1049582 RepID=A0ABT9MDY6_9DEIO|nr:alpha/beta hydrolase [Deinococcus enclensis]MDP9764798.1 pimeloyl-ACP methyl ester carboxylesterase [Deinococcus enclensis]
MPTIQTRHFKAPQTELYHESYGEGRPVVLIHGWPLSGRMWERQVDALRHAGFRTVTYDRRGFGQSGKTPAGYEYDTFAADLNDLLETLDLRDVTLVGFSMGGGEVARYAAHYGAGRLRSAVMMGAVPPLLLQTEDNPDGPMTPDAIQGMVQGIAQNRPKFFGEFARAFFNLDRHAELLGEEYLAFTAGLIYQASPVATQACVHAFSETDFRADLPHLSVPTLILHGDSDQIVPFEKSGARMPEFLPQSHTEVIKDGPHGLYVTHADEVNRALLAFLNR